MPTGDQVADSAQRNGKRGALCRRRLRGVFAFLFNRVGPFTGDSRRFQNLIAADE
jgi:hypothetical protein